MRERRRDDRRDQWAARHYFSTIERFLPLVSQCDCDCEPNYLNGYIGVWHRGLQRSYNFVAFKGSRSLDFSIEIKVDPDPGVVAALEQRGWIVEPWNPVQGYRTHIPIDLNRGDFGRLQQLIVQAFHEWSARQ